MSHFPAGEHTPQMPQITKLTTESFNSCITITFRDDSQLHFEHAFAVREGPYWVLYSEHNGYHVFNVDCVENVTAEEYG
jgi:hypothetical protein